MPSSSSVNKTVDNQNNKWYHFNEESTNVQKNKGILQEDNTDNNLRRRLHRTDTQELDNSSFSLKEKQLEIVLEII